MLPSIEPSEVGLTGLVWLFLSYGYVLYFASNMISEGSELLLLVPSLAGLVGGVVLPLLGAVPDGAIILFSGMGSLSKAQETLSVGVGALAGSTIMLLTIPFGVSVFAGRVDIKEETGQANYLGKPKLSDHSFSGTLYKTGVAMTQAVNSGGKVMVMTTIPYFLIQIPAFFLHGPTQQIAKGEHWWSLGGLLVCLIGLIAYMRLQLKMSKAGEDKLKRIAVTKKLLLKGQVSLSGALEADIRSREGELAVTAATEYQALIDSSGHTPGAGIREPPAAVASFLKEVFIDIFKTYDRDNSGCLDKKETMTFFKDFHENLNPDEFDELYEAYDKDNSGMISFDEFINVAYNLISAHDRFVRTQQRHGDVRPSMVPGAPQRELVDSIWYAETEEEEVPEEFTDLSPEEQQKAIKMRAFVMLAIGTGLVILFSDPMVSVMQEIAVRLGLSPFYVSFILAPLASNASEVLASYYYASKKTTKTMTVSLTALEGAACMNNTFCLSIFMGLIFFRGLAWQYTAETIAIVAVEFIMGVMVQASTLTTGRAVIILLIFPLSLLLVMGLEALGLN